VLLYLGVSQQVQALDFQPAFGVALLIDYFMVH